MVHEPRTSTSPGSWREIQILRAYPSILSQYTQAGAQQSVLTSLPVDFSIHPALKNIVVTSLQMMNSLNVSKQCLHSQNNSHMWLLQSQ